MTPERLDEQLARLERERLDADEQYNNALTALDRALETFAALPEPVPPFDQAALDHLGASANLVPDGPPPIDRSLKGRLRGFIWRLAGPPLENQSRFNARLVEHLRQQATAHEQVRELTSTLAAALRHQADARAAMQSHLIHYLQTVTLFVDTKDRMVAGKIDVLNAGMSAIVDDWMKRWESLSVREARFAHRMETVSDLRASVTLTQQTALSLKRDVERLLERGHVAATNPAGAATAPASAPDLDAFKYLGFEEAFRGPAEEISRRLESYVPMFVERGDVLDVGCGRGEFLTLLAAQGVKARGVDANDAMVEHARGRGLEVTKGDALGHLLTLADGSLGGIFASQVVEHLPPDYLMKFLETARHKLRNGGLIVLETINPACWTAFFESFIRDLTHVKALHPDTLQYLLRVSGFHDVEIEFRSPIAEAARLQPLPEPHGELSIAERDLVETFNENVAKLNARMFTFQDYAAIGRV